MPHVRSFSLLLLAALAACASPPAEPAAKPAGFTLSAAMAREITLDTVRREAVQSVLTLSGEVVTNGDQTVQVFPLVGGVVQELKVELGDHVTKGQVLAVIRSGQIADLQNQRSAAGTDLATARKNLAVLEDQLGVGLASEREVALARQELQKAEGVVTKTQKQLNIYSVTADGLYSLRAPISGFITAKEVAEGMQFNDDNVGALFTIANLDDVWVLANVFESDIARVKEGYAAEVGLLAYPERTFRGRIDRVFNVLDPTSKVMKVRVKLKNPDYLLKPQMYAKVQVRNTENYQMLKVPAQAVIFDKGRRFVMVYRSRHRIETHPVDVLRTEGDRTYVAGGVAVGDLIVSRNQLLLYDALND